MKIKTILLSKKKDLRGWLIENEDPLIRDSMKHFLVSISKLGTIRGQHYHKKKVEWFLVVKGKARIVLKDIQSGETEEIHVSEKKPEMVEMAPMIAHAIENIGRKEMILVAIVSVPFDRKNPDTYSYKVI